jgi:hypothetical protein
MIAADAGGGGGHIPTGIMMCAADAGGGGNGYLPRAGEIRGGLYRRYWRANMILCDHARRSPVRRDGGL